MKNIELTVEDILKRDTFHSSIVLAGKKGLSRTVKWSHIIEVMDIEKFVNGGELILTTGMNLQLDTEGQLAFIEKLINLNTAGLCIEIGTSITNISQEVMAFAEEHNYPIIIFQETVRFIEITQDLHTLLINRHHQMIYDLDHLSNRFNTLSLQPNGILKILQELYHYFQHPAFFLSHDTNNYYFPTDQKHTEKSIKAYIDKADVSLLSEKRFATIENLLYTVSPVRVFEQIGGFIFLDSSENSYNDFYTLVLDRAAMAISQILLRFRTLEERKQNIEEELVRNLLSGKPIDDEAYRSIFPIHYHNSPYRLVIWSLKEPMEWKEYLWDEVKIQVLMVFRSYLQQSGFHPLISIRPHEVVAIVFIPPSFDKELEKGKWNKLMKHLQTHASTSFFSEASFGISSSFLDFTTIKKAYEEAKNVLFLQEKKLIHTPFAEEIGIYRLLMDLLKKEELQNYVQYYLGKIIDYDKKNNSQLMQTLAVYLECSGSKQETANQLFIVRQTLYYRIEKLEALLGKDFLKPLNRLAIEVAIKAYYLENVENGRFANKGEVSG